MKKVNKLLTYGVTLDTLIMAYIKLVIMLMELKEVLSQEL